MQRLRTRREFCRDALGAIAVVAAVGCSSDSGSDSSERAVNFMHGVASGDPLDDRVVLWTRVTVADDAPVAVRWVVARDTELDDLVAEGRAEAVADHDHTVHVDVTGLEPATTYYYRFTAGDSTSVVGRTRTLPRGGVDRVRLAAVSCANYGCGYFVVYRHIAERDDIDCVVHLGDYIYEYEPGKFDVPAANRLHEPGHETVTLADYRIRYAQYRRDRDLQALHQQHPVIAMWDDHEFADNAYDDGAVNHDRDEGSWSSRRESAQRAYLEWLPVRAPDPERIYRTFAFGDLADLVMLDTRHAGREEPPLTAAFGIAGERALLGAEQERWLADTLAESRDRSTAWRVLGTQVRMGPVAPGGVPIYRDQWDSYPEVRARVLDEIGDRGDVVVIAGDIHSSWALDVAPDSDGYDPATGEGAVTVEFVTPSVSALALPEFASGIDELATGRLPHVKWVDLVHHGYLVLDVDRDRVQADWYHADDVTTPDGVVQFAKAFATKAGASHLEEVDGPA